MGVHDYGIYDVISRNAQIFPERECIIFGSHRQTFKGFKERCDSLAAGLIGVGMRKGDRLCVIAQNSDQFIELYGAAAKIGVIVVPVNWRFQQNEMEFILQDCTPRIVFVAPEYRQNIIEIIPKVRSIEKCYSLSGKDEFEGFLSAQDLYTGKNLKGSNNISTESGLVIIYTAAVDGRPKGALLSQANIISINLSMMNQYSINPEDCHICFVPLFHIAGLSLTMAVMHGGGKNVIMERFDAEEAIQLIQKERGTIFFSFPPILENILEKYAGGSYNISSIRNVGGLETPENISRFQRLVPNAVFRSGYGQTEAMAVTGCPYEEKPGSSGKPSVLANVSLFDDSDNEVPVGSPGEICVRSPVVFQGYWGRGEETDHVFRNGWHHTGDIGRFDRDGYLWYMGRKAHKELIKPGGENVYPSEVEKAILWHNSVAEVSVIGVHDPKWGEAIKAVCVLKPGCVIEPQEIIDFVASRIARFKKPKYVVFVEALPKTKEGNVDRDQVKKIHGGLY